MLTIASLALLGGLWFSPSCPTNLQITNTTVGAITNSTELLLCVSKAKLIRGSDGGLKLVLNSLESVPSCLIYPNGLSPDLTYDVLSKGYLGCWSLYPPSQVIAIVNVGRPSRQQIQNALKTFKPAQPRILVKPNRDLIVGKTLQFSNTAKTGIAACKMLTLACQVRFTPSRFSWQIGASKSRFGNPQYKLLDSGWLTANLAVLYKVAYRFLELTNWITVAPGVFSSAPTVKLLIDGLPEEPPVKRTPRLVDKPCGGVSTWGC